MDTLEQRAAPVGRGGSHRDLGLGGKPG
jgi:hypothetical protein